MTLRAILRMLLITCLSFPTLGLAQDRPTSTPGFTEAQIKAAFVMHLTSFIGWPDGSQPTQICLAEQDAVFEALDMLLDSKPGSGLTLRRAEQQPENADCDIVYFNGDAAVEDRAAVPSTALLIGDREGFASEGGMVEFRRAPSRIQLIINSDALKTSGLVASSRLLTLAQVIGGEDTP